MAQTNDLRADKLFSLDSYVCLITGGGNAFQNSESAKYTANISPGSGIGLMAAQALAANGAKVYITGRRREALENASKWHGATGSGRIIPAICCDVTKKDELQKLVDDVSSREKHLDLLVTAAGISGPK